jgi:hypothetical protein
VIAFNTICDSSAIVDMAIKLLCAGKDVNHSAVTIANVGEGAMMICIDEGVFNSKVVRQIEC